MLVNQKHSKFTHVSGLMLTKRCDRRTRLCGKLYILPDY